MLKIFDISLNKREHRLVRCEFTWICYQCFDAAPTSARSSLSDDL